MMMLPEKKRVSTIILSKMNDGEMKDVEAKPEEDNRGEGVLDMIVVDLMKAIEQKSPSGIKDALRAFIDHKDADEEESEG